MKSPLARAAALLGIPQRALAAFVAEYRRAHADERRGRPRAELTAAAVSRACKGRSIREAASLLGVGKSTLAAWLKEHQ